jgi:hypothetical protein
MVGVFSGNPVLVSVHLRRCTLTLAFSRWRAFRRATVFGADTNRTGCLAVTVFCAVIDEGACWY